MPTNLLPISEQVYRTTHRLAHAQIKELDKRTIRINDINHKVKIEEILPFRVQFINVGVFGFSKNNPAGISVAVIGYNNYIL
jgi:hypothetical protein